MTTRKVREVGSKAGSGTGFVALFTGTSGTGKTLAAEVLASELDADLFRVDLSQVVSKYIGETEKNLARVFERASNNDVILFFDEADALFGKRTGVKDAHDRYANIEVSHLMNQIEAFDGIVVLATNNRENIDSRVLRSIDFTIDTDA